MATGSHLKFLILNKDLIKEPVLIVGSKHYDYDKENLKARLTEMGFKDITGIDILEGEDVDYLVDITDNNSEFIKNKTEYFNTVICMEVLTHLRHPFKAAESIMILLKKDGVAVISECYIRKITKMPYDMWRFTYDGLKELYFRLSFYDDKARISLTRDKKEKLFRCHIPLPQVLHGRHPDESRPGYFLRRVHRKFFASGVFRLSRLLPEITIYSVGKK